MPAASQLALCSAVPITAEGHVPDWVHLLPVGEVRTVDGRGPYRVKDVQALMAASLPDGAKLVLDENHSTDLAAPKGGEAPARGWIVELQARQDGIWGRVEWTPRGREIVGSREYRGISPVIAHAKDKTVLAIRRASLVNQPNLEGLTALNSEDNMDFRNSVASALGLAEGATDDEIVSAVRNACGNMTAEAAQAALQSALSPIATAAGLAADADAEAIVAGVTALQAGQGGDDEAVTALQSELAAVTTKLNTLEAGIARQAAETFVDGAIAEGRVGVKPLRDRYIAMHQKDPAGTEELVAAMPKVAGTALHQRKSAERTDLDEADKSVIALMGLDPEEFKKTRAAEAGETEETL